MNTLSEVTTAGAKNVPVTNSTTPPAKSTKDSTWWKRGEHLIQHTPTGTFYCRLKLNGKTIRASLDTDVLTTARARLPLKLAELREPKAKLGTFGHYAEIFKTRTENDTSLSPEGKKYRLRSLDRLLKSWPELSTMAVDKITEDDIENWWNDFSTKYHAQFVNHVLVYFRLILRKLAKLNIDPTADIEPVGVKPKKLILPSMEQFGQIIKSVLANGSPEAQDSADMIEFLAYSGTRISEARAIHWSDVDMEQGEIRIPCAKRRRSSNQDDYRLLPIIPPMRNLLLRMKSRRNPQPQDRVCVLDGCRRSLTNACKRNDISILTHHSMRHFFVSVCLEAGIDFATIARWVGHSDGGLLVARTYGHLRKEHSQLMAQKVKFLPVIDAEIVETKLLPAAN